MKMELRIAEWIKSGGLLLVVSSLVLTGCQAARLTYEGAKVVDTYRIALAEGIQRNATYRSADLTIDYSMMRSGEELQLSGVAEFTPKIRNGYGYIAFFDLSVLLTDREGTILRQKGIVTPGSNDPKSRMRFSEKIPLPPGTANMAFSYSIEARGEGTRETSSFWEVPIVR
jgi:hypothetical protein